MEQRMRLSAGCLDVDKIHDQLHFVQTFKATISGAYPASTSVSNPFLIKEVSPPAEHRLLAQNNIVSVSSLKVVSGRQRGWIHPMRIGQCEFVSMSARILLNRNQRRHASPSVNMRRTK